MSGLVEMGTNRQAYIAEICSRFGARQRVRFDPACAGENGSQAGRCHANVDA
jgi:hypothetical protein